MQLHLNPSLPTMILGMACIGCQVPQADTSGSQSLADTGAPPQRPDAEYGLSEQRLSVDGEPRDYELYVPESYSHDQAAPVVLNFHGGGGSARSQRAVSDMRSLADTHNFLLVYPEGTLLENGSTHWNPLPPGAEGKSDANDFGFIAALIDELSSRYQIDPLRVYATGYSNGAGMAYGLACYLSDRIAAIAPVSGSMYAQMQTDCPANQPTGVAIFNGTQDAQRPYDGFPGWFLSVDDAATFWASHNQTAASPQIDELRDSGRVIERTRYGSDSEAQVVKHKVMGGGHEWFDLNLDGANLDETIWSFFAQHDRDGGR